MQPHPKTLVERFYHELWNQADETVAKEILHPDFRFRASLGPELSGADGFIAYMRSVHRALGDYRCIIDDLIATDSRAAARMTFRGVHQNDFFGVPASGEEIVWSGAAFFSTEGGQLSELWVLGDIDSVKQQLGAAAAAGFTLS